MALFSMIGGGTPVKVETGTISGNSDTSLSINTKLNVINHYSVCLVSENVNNADVSSVSDGYIVEGLWRGTASTTLKDGIFTIKNLDGAHYASSSSNYNYILVGE